MDARFHALRAHTAIRGRQGKIEEEQAEEHDPEGDGKLKDAAENVTTIHVGMGRHGSSYSGVPIRFNFLFRTMHRQILQRILYDMLDHRANDILCSISERTGCMQDRMMKRVRGGKNARTL